jgi:hypothetical protein
MQDWLFLKTAENPDRDMAKLSREFMRGYYGAAAEPMERLLTALEDGQQKVFARLDMDYISRMDSGNMAMYAVRAGFRTGRFLKRPIVVWTRPSVSPRRREMRAVSGTCAKSAPSSTVRFSTTGRDWKRKDTAPI